MHRRFCVSPDQLDKRAASGSNCRSLLGCQKRRAQHACTALGPCCCPRCCAQLLNARNMKFKHINYSRSHPPRGACLSHSFEDASQGTTCPLCTRQYCMTAVPRVGEAEQAALTAVSRLKGAMRLVFANERACWQVLRQRLRPDMKTVQEQQQQRQQHRACVFQQARFSPDSKSRTTQLLRLIYRVPAAQLWCRKTCDRDNVFARSLGSTSLNQQKLPYAN